MLKVLVLAMAVSAACVPAYADEAEKAQLGKDDFVSGAINDMFTKIGQYTSGEKSVIIEDFEDQPDNGMPVAPKASGPRDGKAPSGGAHW